MAHVRITKLGGFNYYWNATGNHTAYPEGWEGVVKREVADAVLKAKAGVDTDAEKNAREAAKTVKAD
jgi:hypothetical protein